MEDDVYAAPESGFESHSPRGVRSFSIARCLNEGGEGFRQNPGPGILASIVMVVLLGAAYFAFLTSIGAVAGTGDDAAIVGILVIGFGGALGLYFLYRMLQAGMQILGMQVQRGAGRVEDVFAGFHRPGPICGATAVIYFLQLIVPLILFILALVLVISSEAIEQQIEAMESDDVGLAITGVLLVGIWLLKLYLDARLLLVYPLILERKSSAIAAIVQSWRMTAPVQVSLAFLTLLTEIIFLAGFLCCGIGALVTAPVHYAIQGAAALNLLADDTAGEGDAQDSVDPAENGPGDDRFGHPDSLSGYDRPTPPAAPSRDSRDTKRDPGPYDASPYS